MQGAWPRRDAEKRRVHPDRHPERPGSGGPYRGSRITIQASGNRIQVGLQEEKEARRGRIGTDRSAEIRFIRSIRGSSSRPLVPLDLCVTTRAAPQAAMTFGQQLVLTKCATSKLTLRVTMTSRILVEKPRSKGQVRNSQSPSQGGGQP